MDPLSARFALAAMAANRTLQHTLNSKARRPSRSIRLRNICRPDRRCLDCGQTRYAAGNPEMHLAGPANLTCPKMAGALRFRPDMTWVTIGYPQQRLSQTIVLHPAWLGHLHVPEERCSELQDIPDVGSECCWLDPFSPRDVRELAEGNLLDFVRDLLASCFIARAHPSRDELLKLRDVRPTEPGSWTGARHREVNGWIHDVGGLPPSVQQIPTTLIGWLLARPCNQVRRPVHCL